MAFTIFKLFPDVLKEKSISPFVPNASSCLSKIFEKSKSLEMHMLMGHTICEIVENEIGKLDK